MSTTSKLMEIGKLSLIKTNWSWGATIHLAHEESHPAPHSDELIETDIEVDEAKELVRHLQNFIDEVSDQRDSYE